MRYAEDPPYEVLSTRDVSFKELQRMGRFARYWDLVANSGNFTESRASLLQAKPSPFEAFSDFSEWLYSKVGKRSSINLKTLAELVFVYLTSIVGLEAQEVGPLVARDYTRGGRSDLPRALAEFSTAEPGPRSSTLALKRQRRTVSEAHVGDGAER